MKTPQKTELKTFWTWEEWRAGRSALKKITDSVAPRVIRRKKSSSDNRLKAAYAGKRGPDF
ncbi:MAG: hypothetical protein PHC61_11735 [Chitinivibrionales bacterium]|nr:hypothetical protein [Chitinivibrionales bacterium]